MKKIAVVLMNLGGPDGPEAVEPFLYNLFSDPAILRVPNWLRRHFAKFIARRRGKVAKDIYAQIGGKSPILENTQAQARALEKAMSSTAWIRGFVVMRYWKPYAEDALAEIKRFVPDEIVLLPLYPQFSTTTTESSLAAWRLASRQAKLDIPESIVSAWPTHPGLIEAFASLARQAWENACETCPPLPHGAYNQPRILFSAHGLPESIVRAGDPYPEQCRQTAEAIARAMGIPDLDWVLCFQSRVGPVKWIGPSTEREIRRAGADKRPIVIVPISFVSEHSETLVEIDIEYRKLAKKCDVPCFIYAGTPGTHPAFIAGLADMIVEALQQPRREESPLGSPFGALANIRQTG
ncbi:MAG: ferrochelatase [Bdellovibrionales bacterium]